jgi:hypothetical protein
MNASVQHVEQQLQSFETDAGEAAGESVGANEHNGAGGKAIEGITDTDGVADQNVALQSFNLIERDDAIFEGAETGGDAIGNAPFAEHGLDGLGGALDLRAGGIGEGDERLAGRTVGQFDQLRDRQVFAIEKQLRNQTGSPY